MESSCTSQLKIMSHHVLHNKIMSDNSSCSSPFKCIRILIYSSVIFYQEGTNGTTVRLIGTHMWSNCVMSSISTGSTKCHYKHSTNSYLYLSPLLKRNDGYSRASSPISPVIIVGIGIWYLAGGKLSDIQHVFGVSISEAYNCIKCFLDRILCCESMKIMLPRTPEEWDEVAARFAKVS